MKRSRLFNLLVATLFGATIGTPPASVADDTEIYLGSTATQQGVRPNVLFILDTSGSMSTNIDSNGDRMDHMKNAFFEIMENVNNINVGLMRFTDPGGPVLWPISYVNEDVDVVEGSTSVGVDVNVRVEDDADDAEEDSAGVVDTSSVDLNILDTVTGGSATITAADDPGMRVINQNNNAEQSGSDIITLNRIDMNGSQTNAVRFNSVPIPPGAVVTSANVVFTSSGGNAGSPNFIIRGESNVTPATFPTSCSGCSAVTSRTTTTASTAWAPGGWGTNEKSSDTTTDDLSAIVQEIIDLPGWVSGNPMVFIIDPSTTGGSRGAYTFNGSGGTASLRPELVVTFNTGAVAGTQIVGMRFNDVAIPQGATINSAVLEFFPSEPLSTDINVDIVGELSDDADAFTTSNSDLSGRPKTAAVNWVETDDWDDVDVAHQTVDIAPVIQAIVDQVGWCGNNSLALFLQERVGGANGPLSAFSYDGDQSRAPILRVDVDSSSIDPDACINNIVTSQIFVSSDDAEQVISTGGMSLSGASFDMRSGQINGLRFQDIPITQGATVVEAKLRFVVRSANTGATTLRFRTEAADDASPFTGSNSNISDRSAGASSVDWVAPDFDIVGDVHETVDITPIIQEVIDRSGWSEFNSLVILQSHVSGGLRRARSFDHDAIDAPTLILKVQGANATASFTVRTKLEQLVDGFDHGGFTPIVDTLYEAALYYRGDPVDWGKQRGFDNASGNPACASPPHRCNDTGSNPTVRRNTRISHPASWTGGTVVRPAGCTDANLSSSACEDEVVTGSPTYISPIEESCQANYIVLLTDGFANHNDSVPRVNTNFGLTCVGGGTADDTCAVEIAGMLANQDQIAELSGDQNVFTYTVGFGDPSEFDGAFLGGIATAGGGEFFTAVSGAELAEVFQTIIADILNRSTSFATPSLSVNAFNKLFDLDDVYFSLFIPDNRVAWRGNVKRYQICSEVADGCELGEVLDATGASAISDIDSRILDSALSFWSSEVDGSEIELGGAAEQIPDPANRQVYTFANLTAPPDNEDLTLTVNEVIDADGDGVLDGIDGHPDHPDPVADTQFLLGDDAAILSAAQRKELIDWIRGRDVDDEDEDGDTAERRFVFADPLHSSPVAITFGGDADDPVIKLFVGTNDGGLMMINAESGIEEWVFYPQTMLRQLQTLRANSNGDHLYGLDGVPAPWIFDANEDGIIDQSQGDFVRVIVGQRRGGFNYYAVDVTPSSPVDTDPLVTGEVTPTYMWRIEGGTGDYPSLGQTWSRPVVTTIRVGNTTAGQSELQDVIIFAGGYDEGQDNGFYGPSSPGNAIYIADAATGELVFTLSSDDPGVGDNLVVPDMNCPIPSDVAVFDSNGDGSSDRMYVGDTCGQVFRVDIRPNTDAGFEGIKAVVGKFAELSELDDDPSFELDHRKIFFRPDVVQVLNTEFTTTARYDLVVVVTGRRDNPLNIDVQDRAYALRDFHVDPLTDVDEDGFADIGTYDTVIGPTDADAGDLFDATTLVLDPTGSDLTDLQNADGWYIDLQDNGEKALAAPVILSGKLFFTTYLPEGVVDASACALAEGSGRLFAVNVLTGGVALNFDDADGTETLTLSDKTYSLGAGIPSSAVPIFQEEGITLLVGGGGGATSIDPSIALPKGRTYWYQQQ